MTNEQSIKKRKCSHTKKYFKLFIKIVKSFSIALGGREWIEMDYADSAINTNSFGGNIVPL